MKGILRRYIAKMTGLSRAQVTPLLSQYQATGTVQERPYQCNRFVKRYTAADSELLAAVHEAHPTLSGPATLKVLYREFHHYGAQRYAWLASISVAHIYNLRESRAYRERYICYPKTRAVQVVIGGRRRPDPRGQPGYLRVDTVHQGDLEGSKGPYHIHAVDEVTQWEVVGPRRRLAKPG